MNDPLVYSLDELVVVWQFIRVYNVFRLSQHFSYWTEFKSTRYCENYSVNADTMFALKAYMKTMPYLVVFTLLLVSVFLCGMAFRIFERPYPDSDFEPIWNGWWLIMVTMTTIGYGEIVPKTHLGRLIATAACIWGIFLISSFVVALTNKVEIEGEEKEIYNKLVERIYIRKKLKLIATKFIQRWWRLMDNRKKADVGSTRIELLYDHMTSMRRFKRARVNNMIIPELQIRDIMPEFETAAGEFNQLVLDMSKSRQYVIQVAREIQSFNIDYNALHADLDNISTRYLRLYNLAEKLEDDKQSFPIQSLDQVEIKKRKDTVRPRFGKQGFTTIIPVDSDYLKTIKLDDPKRRQEFLKKQKTAASKNKVPVRKSKTGKIHPEMTPL